MTTEEQVRQEETSLSPDGKVYVVDRHVNPQQMWSVTTILNALPKPFLVNWAAAMTADKALDVWEPVLRALKDDLTRLYADTDPEAVPTGVSEEAEVLTLYGAWKQGRETMTRLLEQQFGVDPITMKNQRGTPDGMIALLTRGTKSGRQTVRRRLSRAPEEYREERAEIGSEVHAAIEAYVVNGEAPQVSEMAEPYLKQFWRFLRDWKPEILASEMVVYSETARHAGTLDMICKCPQLAALLDYQDPGDVTFIVDHKTGKNVYPEAALQLAAYRHSEFYEHPEQTRDEDGERFAMPQVDAGFVLHLTESTYEIVPADTGDEQYLFFKYLTEMFRWTEQRAQYALFEPILPDMEPTDA